MFSFINNNSSSVIKNLFNYKEIIFYLKRMMLNVCSVDSAATLNESLSARVNKAIIFKMFSFA